MRKYICDRCGAETQASYYLYEIGYTNRHTGQLDMPKLEEKTWGEVCGKCLEEIQEFTGLPKRSSIGGN